MGEKNVPWSLIPKAKVVEIESIPAPSIKPTNRIRTTPKNTELILTFTADATARTIRLCIL